MRKNMCRIIFFMCRIISPRRDVVFVQNFFCPALLKVCSILLGKFFKNRQKSEIMNCQFVFIFRHGLRRFLDIRTEEHILFSRKGAKGAKRYVLLYFCQKYCTQTTQNHADAWRNFAPLREKNMFFCQKSLHTESTKTHRICSACFCESLRRLRETITLRTAFCVFRGFCVRPYPLRKAFV